MSAVPRWLPSPTMLVLAVIGTLLVFVAAIHGLTDADYFWHVTAGRLIATTGRVPSADPFSFTYAGGAWTPHEWLGELLIYLVVNLGGWVAVIVFGAVGTGSVGLGIFHARWAGVRVPSIALSAAIATAVLIPYITVRPQAISWLLLAGLMWFLAALSADRPRRALWLIPLFALWANVHGLYVVALGVVAVWTVATLLGRTRMAGAGRWALIAAVGALAASMLTPAGPAGLLYPLRYLQPGNWGLAHIQEWQSPDFHDPANVGLLVLVGALVLVGWRRAPSWQALVVTIMVLISLVSLRNAPLAAVTALPVLAAGLDAVLPGPSEAVRRPAVARARRAMETALAAVLMGVIVMLMLPRVEGDRASAIRQGLPVAGVDQLLARQPSARVFAEYGWAGYVIYRMYNDGGRVFVDGRNDMYPEQILEDYSAVRAASEGWQLKLDDYGVNAILLPPDAPLVAAAEHDATWCEPYRDNGQALLVRCSGG